jgi:3-oxoacyl-[acyl-carrier-protein] synthase-1
MQAALASAGLGPEAIEYVNLHGTGTPSNDRAESRAVTGLFGAGTPCSSTKGATGHTLGAAGALEAVICALALQDAFLPGGVGSTHVDPELSLHYLTGNLATRATRVLSNSFGFGGTNCSLILGRAG